MGMKMLFSQWHRLPEKKIRVLTKEVEPMTFFSPDALPLSYRRLVGAKATKLASCEKHLAYCLDWNVDMCFLNEANDRNLMVNSDFCLSNYSSRLWLFPLPSIPSFLPVTLRPIFLSSFLCLLPFLLSFLIHFSSFLLRPFCFLPFYFLLSRNPNLVFLYFLFSS